MWNHDFECSSKNSNEIDRERFRLRFHWRNVTEKSRWNKNRELGFGMFEKN